MPQKVSKPSLEIAATTGRKEACRAELKKLLWTYIKNNNLQCEDPKHYSKFGVSLLERTSDPICFQLPPKMPLMTQFSHLNIIKGIFIRSIL